jgi:glycosyltransferase involved in cell wall biosynthesis
MSDPADCAGTEWVVRVVLYTHHSLFEPALSLAAALADVAEVHLLMEVPASNDQVAHFEAGGHPLPSGRVEADAVLAPFYPAEVRALWRRAASFQLVVTGAHRARDPRSLRELREVLAWVREIRADVLHVDDVDVSSRLALALALGRSPCPIVLGCHDPEPHSDERHWRFKRLTRFLMLPRAAAYVVHHRAGLQALRRSHPRLRHPIHVVRLGAYTFLSHQPAPDVEPDDRLVLLFGRMTKYKGLEALYRAAPLVARAVPGVRFVVAGRPVPGYQLPPAPALEAGGRIETRYDYVRAADVAALFNIARIAVCPYTDASQSGVVLTAFAFGCPVVATDVGGLPEYVRDGTSGLVVPANDDKALADALIRCLNEPDLVTSLRAGVAQAVAGELSWDRAASEVLDVYRGVVGANRPGRFSRSRRPG